MKRKKQKNVVVTEQPTNTTPVQAQPVPPVTEMSPSDDLQVYYNDAYMREKQRLNEIFGVIVEDTPTVKSEHLVEPDLSDYVLKSDYKKLKRRLGFFVVTTVVFAVLAIALAAIVLL